MNSESRIGAMIVVVIVFIVGMIGFVFTVGAIQAVNVALWWRLFKHKSHGSLTKDKIGHIPVVATSGLFPLGVAGLFLMVVTGILKASVPSLAMICGVIFTPLVLLLAYLVLGGVWYAWLDQGNPHALSQLLSGKMRLLAAKWPDESAPTSQPSEHN